MQKTDTIKYSLCVSVFFTALFLMITLIVRNSSGKETLFDFMMILSALGLVTVIFLSVRLLFDDLLFTDNLKIEEDKINVENETTQLI